MKIRAGCLRRSGDCHALLAAFLIAISTSAPTAQPLAAGNRPSGNQAGWAKGHILVMPRAGLPDTEFKKALAPHGGKVIGRLENLDVYVVSLPAHASEEAVANLLAHNPHMKFAEPDRLVAPGLTANDVYYNSEWHLQSTKAPAAWNSSLGNGITVAVLDTGVDATHPDLQGQLVPGWNFWDNTSNTSDVYGHGTLVAGVIGAKSNNATGVTSMAWNARIMPMRISDTNGYGSWSAMASALTWAADHGAKVANISYMVQNSATVQSAAQYFRNKGGVVVNSAGNTGSFDAAVASDALVSVSATDGANNRASWSTYGAYVDFAAPGVGIWSTARGGSYASVSGTSFSSPLTAGVVALMMAANSALSPSQIVTVLRSTALDMGTPGYDQYYGYGLIDAGAAVQASLQTQVKDTQPPTVAIASPIGGTVTGIVPVGVNATDDSAVTRVDLLVNGGLYASDVTAPFAFSWASSAFAGTSPSLTARAYDAAGNVASSNIVVVTVANATVAADTTPPAVSIINPINGSRVSGQVNVKVSSSDNVGIGSVSLYVDDVMVSSSNSTSMSYRWNTNKAGSGAHAIRAVAKDRSGNQTATSIQVTK